MRIFGVLFGSIPYHQPFRSVFAAERSAAFIDCEVEHFPLPMLVPLARFLHRWAWVVATYGDHVSAPQIVV